MGPDPQAWIIPSRFHRAWNSSHPSEGASRENGCWSHSAYLDSILSFPWRQTTLQSLDVPFANRSLCSRKGKRSSFQYMARKLRQQYRILSKSTDLEFLQWPSQPVLQFDWNWLRMQNLKAQTWRANRAIGTMPRTAVARDSSFLARPPFSSVAHLVLQMFFQGSPKRRLTQWWSCHRFERQEAYLKGQSIGTRTPFVHSKTWWFFRSCKELCSLPTKAILFDNMDTTRDGLWRESLGRPPLFCRRA